MDIADDAQIIIDRAVEVGIENARTASAPMLITGYCHNCYEPIPALFCDEDCRDDWQRLKDNGR